MTKLPEWMETNESRSLEGKKKRKIAKEEARERGGEKGRRRGREEGRKDSRVRMEMKKNC